MTYIEYLRNMGRGIISDIAEFFKIILAIGAGLTISAALEVELEGSIFMAFILITLAGAIAAMNQ